MSPQLKKEGGLKKQVSRKYKKRDFLKLSNEIIGFSKDRIEILSILQKKSLSGDYVLSAEIEFKIICLFPEKQRGEIFRYFKVEK